MGTKKTEAPASGPATRTVVSEEVVDPAATDQPPAAGEQAAARAAAQTREAPSANLDRILAALTQLDPADPKHWLDSGLPDATHVSNLAGVQITQVALNRIRDLPVRVIVYGDEVGPHVPEIGPRKNLEFFRMLDGACRSCGVMFAGMENMTPALKQVQRAAAAYLKEREHAAS